MAKMAMAPSAKCGFSQQRERQRGGESVATRSQVSAAFSWRIAMRARFDSRHAGTAPAACASRKAADLQPRDEPIAQAVNFRVAIRELGDS